jgi:MerR family transcriptional regulator, mercuric resistance operon regulatory protein
MAKLTIGALSGATGVHLETIRYYERTGLLQPPRRTAAGHRVYDATDVERLRLIRCARQFGFPTDVVRSFVRLSEEQPGGCSEAYALASAQIQQIDDKLAELIRIREMLVALVQDCPDAAAGGAPCPMLVGMKKNCCAVA